MKTKRIINKGISVALTYSGTSNFLELSKICTNYITSVKRIDIVGLDKHKA